MLDQRGAAFDPVAIIAVDDAIDCTDVGGMDVAADNAIGAPALGLGDNGNLIVADVFDRVLDLVFDVL